MKKVGRKAASILLTLCMLLTMLPVSALAVDEGTVVDTAPAETNLAEPANNGNSSSDDSLPVSTLGTDPEGDADVSVEYVDENKVARTCTDYTVVTSSDTVWSAGWYVVTDTVNLTSRVQVSGNVHLILTDGAALNAEKGGIGVTAGNSLTIYGQSAGTGTLTARAYQVRSAAAIGGNDDSGAHGDITINGGVINATGASDAAGIGGGRSATGRSGTITINGGTVKATSGGNGAGIGGGYANGADGGDITITGGEVTAVGGIWAAGIGTGFSGAGMKITITGGTVNATGGSNNTFGGAGIGAGYSTASGAALASITITGGDVTAKGGSGAAGIGSGSGTNAAVGAIEISGSAEVHATGGNSDTHAGAGIGAGGSGNCGSITIGGDANVTAIGGTSSSYSGAGIGAGGGNGGVDYVEGGVVITPTCNEINITGGTVNATGGSGADGIGGNASSTVESVSISGGTFTANTFPNGEIPADYLADGYELKQDADGTWSVEKEETPPAPTGVAQIGDQTYPTLEAAFAAVGSEAVTIKLLADTQISNAIEVPEGKTITLDLNGCAVTVPAAGSDGRSLYAINNKGTLTICDNSTEQDGSITARGIQNIGNGILTINSGTFISCDANGGAAVWNEATAYINGGTFKAVFVGSASDNYGPGCLNNSGTAVITAGTFESVNKRTYAVISTGTITITPAEGKEVIVSGAHGGLAVDSGVAVVNGGSFSSTEYYGLYVSNDGQGEDPMQAAVTVNGGTFTGANYSVWIGSDYNNPVNSTIAIHNGIFMKPLNAQSNTREGAVQVYGGTFYQEVPQEYCADGFVPKQNDDGTWGVVTETTYVAQIGETNKYATLSEALNDVKNGETIKVLAPATVDMAETYVITGKTITLDLNGQTVAWDTSAKEAITVKDSGSLTIQDTSANEAGELAFTSTYTDPRDSTGIYVNPNGTFALQSGTISYTAAKDGRAIYVGGTGTFAMSGGTVKIAGRAKYGVYLSSNNSTNITGGEIILSDTLTGTTLYGLYVFMLADAQGLAIENLTVDASAVPAAQCAYCITGGWNSANNAPVTISGGTYTTNENTLSKAIFYSTVKNLTISGGTFNGVVDSATTITDGTFQKAVEVTDTITGGTFEGNVTAPSGKISGGKFKVVNPPYDWNLADGKSLEQKDGYYCVVDDTNTKVAEVGDVQYATLEEAIKKAQSGQTVELLANATVLERIAIADKNITIDTNGYSVIYSGDADHKSAIIDLEGKAQVVVTGNGTFTFNDAYLDYNGFGYIFRLYDNSVLTIENGTYYAGLTCVQVGDSSAAYIKDGHFSASTDWKDTWWVLNRIDNNNSKFYVSGGTFVNYDPTNSDTESPTDNFCTPEYAATPTKDESGNTIYTVVEAEARIGETGYVTLADAIAAAGDNDTITLLADVTEDVVVPADKTITLDLNGYKITNAADHTIVNNGTLTITDSSEAKTGTVDNIAHGHAAIYNNGTMTIEAGTYTRSLETQDYVDDDADNSWYTVVNDGTMTINGGTFTTADGQPENLGNRSSLVRNGDDATSNTGVTLTITGGQFISGANVIKNEQGSVIASISGGTFTMDNSRIAWYGGNNVIQTYGTITSITGGTFKALGDGTPIDKDVIYYRHGIGVYGEGKIENIGGTVSFEMEGSQNRLIRCDDTGSINITGGTYELADREGNNNVLIYKGDETAKIAISGGTFSDEPDDAYLAEGYAPEYDAESDTWGVVKDNSVAEIVGGQKYESLIDAVNVAKVSGKTVKLLANVENLQAVEGKDYALLIDNGESMTLDLNGHKITATLNNTEEFNLIKNYGGLTITDDSEGQKGSIEVTENGSHDSARTSILYNGYDTGKFTLEAGTLKLTGGEGSKKPLYGVYSSGTTVVMNGGAIEVRRLNSYYEYSESWDVYGIYNSSGCQTTVNGGTITVENQGMYNSAYGIFNASGTVSIHGDPNTPYIEANAFDEGTWYEHTLYGNITLYGGKYNMLTDTATGWIESDIIIADGYEDHKNGDGTVSIIKSPVAQIGSTKYHTLEEAVAHVQPGETITMLTDVEEGSGIIVPSGSNFTIDFAGHTYKVVGNLAGSTGTESQCFQLLRDSNITMKNGTIVANNSGITMIIQNYANLTLDDMTLDATQGINNVGYVMSNNCGNVTITGDTDITAKTTGVAFDVYYWPSGSYVEGVTVTVDENMTGTITGKIEYAADDTAQDADVAEKAKLNIEAGTFIGSIVTTETNHGISISGGSFSEKPKEDYLAPYYDATKGDGDTYWTVDVAADVEAIWITDTDTKAGMLSNLLDEATSGTVQLLKDVTATNVIVSDPVTLDLNGNTLTATVVAMFDGAVVDSTEGKGLLKVGVTRNDPNVTLKENNPSLLIYDSDAAGYRLYSYTFEKLRAYTTDQSGNSMGFYFQLTFENLAAWGKLNTAETTHGVIMSTVLELPNKTIMTVYFDQSTIQGVAGSIVGGAAQTGKGFWLTVTGLNKLEAGQMLKVTPTLEAAGDKLVINTEAFEYSKSADESN